MPKLKSLLFLLLIVCFGVACSSSKSKEECIKIYEEGMTKIRQANSQKEISDISYDVARKIVDISKGPDGEEILSASDQADLFSTQQKFYQTIESRARQLNENAAPAQNEEPIMRTSIK